MTGRTNTKEGRCESFRRGGGEDEQCVGKSVQNRGVLVVMEAVVVACVVSAVVDCTSVSLDRLFRV